MNIKIYSKTNCIFCFRAKEWFQKNNINYEEIQINDKIERQKFYESCGNSVKTMPQIFVDEKRIGGWKELQEFADQILSNNIAFSDNF